MSRGQCGGSPTVCNLSFLDLTTTLLLLVVVIIIIIIIIHLALQPWVSVGLIDNQSPLFSIPHLLLLLLLLLLLPRPPQLLLLLLLLLLLQTPWPLVRRRTIPTERPPLLAIFSGNFCG
jgi:hypothetical protein